MLSSLRVIYGSLLFNIKVIVHFGFDQFVIYSYNLDL